jgi:hypothetical protein
VKKSLWNLSALVHFRPHAGLSHGDGPQSAMQETFASEHPWFHVHKLNARSHFPMFEVAEEMAEAIKRYVRIGEGKV